MMDVVWFVASLAVGALLGGFYFGGLWLTVRKVATARRPALLLIGSFAARAGIVLAAMYFVFGGRWERLLACAAGLLLARTLLILRLRDSDETSSLPAA